MYVNAHLAEDRVLVYAEAESSLSDFTSLRKYVCLDCYFEFTSSDGEQCPACGSSEVYRER